jgi:hypothetical protein
VDPIRVGDVVFVVNDLLPRNSWPKGIIEELFPGKDGIVRVVTVRTTTGTYRRPVSKICVLDVKKGEDLDSEPTLGGPCHLQHHEELACPQIVLKLNGVISVVVFKLECLIMF